MVWGSNPGVGENFRTCPDRPWGPPSLLYNGYQVFLGVKVGRSVTLTLQLLLVPRSKKSRAIPLLLLWTIRPVQSLSACTRVHFTLPLPSQTNTRISTILVVNKPTRIIQLIERRRKKWEEGNEYRILVGKRERKRQIGMLDADGRMIVH